MKMKNIFSGVIVFCSACMFLAAGCRRASNKPTTQIPIAIVSVRYIVDDVGTAIELHAKLTQLASVRDVIDDAYAAAGLYVTHLCLAVDLTDGGIGITNGRARAIVAAVVGLIGLVVGGLALAGAAGRIGSGNGRAAAIVAVALGLIGMVLSVVHLGSSTGGFGSGGGRAGAIVALVLGLIAINLGGLALARSRRARITD